MASMTVYLDHLEEEEERQRRRTKQRRAAIALLLGSAALAPFLLGNAPKVPSAAVPPEPLERIVYRTILQYTETIGPAPAEAPPVVRKKKVEETLPLPATTKDLPESFYDAPFPAGELRPEAHPSVSPIQIEFQAGGWELVAVLNPHEDPITIEDITVRNLAGGRPAGFDVAGAKRCIRTLAPRESCRFAVIARDLPAGTSEAIRIDVRHSRSEESLTTSIFSRQ